jgi:hypothetical protein
MRAATAWSTCLLYSPSLMSLMESHETTALMGVQSLTVSHPLRGETDETRTLMPDEETVNARPWNAGKGAVL